MAVATPTSIAGAAVNKTEAKCAAKMAGAASKLAATVAKETSKCRDGEIAGKNGAPCPEASGQAKIDKIADKLSASIVKSCGSVCSSSTSLSCLSDAECPPDGASTETCDGDGAKIEAFHLSNLGFPGPFCEAVLDGPITGTDDLADCVGTLTTRGAGTLIELVYGEVTSATGISPGAASCLAATSKAAQKTVKAIYKGVIKCRAAIHKDPQSQANPTRCTLDDAKLAAKIAKANEKLAATVTSKCTDEQVAELDLCGNGLGGTLTTAEAAECVVAAATEVADTPTPAAARLYAPLSLVDAAYPPASATCGDGVANQIPNSFFLAGEECDIGDDDACPGECLPPGDAFECTCGNTPRMMPVTIGEGSDLEIGWTGFSHDHQVADGSAFLVDLVDCDCDEMTGATCTGSTSDPVCSTPGRQMPRCSWDLAGSTRCDDHGDVDGVDEPADCAVCDGFSANAGSYCTGQSDCQAQCFDAAGVAGAACSAQSDCPAGQRCRGHCDQTQTCAILTHGPPLPTSTLGSPVCLLNLFTDDVTGTQNMVTGENERFQRRITISYNGEAAARPCPVCGGVCTGLPQSSPIAQRPCEGTCSGGVDRCRLDSDCPGSETCTSVSAECGSGSCNLTLNCVGGTRAGLPCRLQGAPGPFGTPSNDCPPDPNLNFSAGGTRSDFLPATSEIVSLASDIVPCTAAGFTHYDCVCPVDDGGIPNKPNQCWYACDSGAELGDTCAGGAAGAGAPTRCAGGDNAGDACDEDADCAPGGGTCSANPTHCVGDLAFEHVACTTNAECGAGTCTDACPSGRCVPLCVPSAGDPEDGECAAGPIQALCSGPHDYFRICSTVAAAGSCSATCSVSASACQSNADCPLGETCNGPCPLATACEAGVNGILGDADDIPGAGICATRPLNCTLNAAFAEGGDTLNGKGSSDLSYSVTAYCIEANVSPAANIGAGLGGPGRLRVYTANLTNGMSVLP